MVVGGVWRRAGDTNGRSYATSEVIVYHVQRRNNILSHREANNMRDLEAESINNHLLLCRNKGIVEQTRLSIEVTEGRAIFTDKVAAVVTGGSSEETISNGLVGLHRGAHVQGVGGICVLVGRDG